MGVPIAIKDDVDLAGETTAFGCGGERKPASTDAGLVRRLRGAGAIVIGKTNASEVGQWPFTESANFGAELEAASEGKATGHPAVVRALDGAVAAGAAGVERR